MGKAFYSRDIAIILDFVTSDLCRGVIKMEQLGPFTPGFSGLWSRSTDSIALAFFIEWELEISENNFTTSFSGEVKVIDESEVLFLNWLHCKVRPDGTRVMSSGSTVLISNFEDRHHFGSILDTSSSLQLEGLEKFWFN